MKLIQMKFREGVIGESVVVGLTTLAIGSALMLVPVKSKWWLFAGTFIVGFVAHMGYEAAGMNEWFCDNRK